MAIVQRDATNASARFHSHHHNGEASVAGSGFCAINGVERWAWVISSSHSTLDSRPELSRAREREGAREPRERAGLAGWRRRVIVVALGALWEQ
jgi:hypothetical protein